MNVDFFSAKLPEPFAADLRKLLAALLEKGSDEDLTDLSVWLSSPGVLEKLASGLSGTERRTLRIVVASFACESFDAGKLEKAGRAQLSGSALQVALLRLCRKGILFAMHKSWGEQLYALPEDTLMIWNRLLFPTGEPEIGTRSEELPAATVSLEKPLPSARILTLLAYCARVGLPLTKNGTLVKRHLQKLITALNLEAAESPVPDIHYAEEDSCPFTLVALLDVCLRLELLELKPGQYVLNPIVLKGWLSKTEAEMNQAIYACLCPWLMPTEPQLRHWAVRSEDVKPGEWFSVEGIVQELEQRGIIGEGMLDISRILQAWLVPLCSLGYLELGRSAADGYLTRWTTAASGTRSHVEAAASAKTKETVFVQPDLEIIVPPGVPYPFRWELERLTELEHAGAISRYRLTQERIRQAVEGGYEGKQIVSILSAYAKYGVPDLVEHSILQWAGQCDTSFNEKSPSLSAPDPQQPSAEYRLPQQKAGGNAEGLIYSRVSVQYYDIERNLPRTEDLYPGLQDVPNMWLKECRSYHAATRMDMIRKALEWKACVRLKQQGQEQLLVPERLEATSDGWLVAGFHPGGEVKLSPQQWDEMQLVLPGINDEGL